MKLNLGCGHSRMDGFVNVDKFPSPACDEIVDLESLPWPWLDSSVDEVVLCHVLEHLGADTPVYLGIIKELWRVCRDGALILISVPHPNHDHFLWDPTHVRPITWEGLRMFDQERNREWIAAGSPMTPLGLHVGVNFRLEHVQFILDEPWASRERDKTIPPDELQFAMKHYHNVISEMIIRWRAVKP
ncbi:MAG: hypothetical protein HY055_08210 [Magnetospirillum sp.]|nr:hypothetical protein [Magnetospirillum sp.]